MHTNKLFSLYYIAGVPYLLPQGQLIVDHYKGVKINETGEFIWNTLNGGCHDFEELLSACALHYEAEGDEVNIIRKDILEFVNYLKSMNIIVEDSVEAGTKADTTDYNSLGSSIRNFNTESNSIYSFLNSIAIPDTSTHSLHQLCIAGININIKAPAGTVAEEFSPFAIQSDIPIDVLSSEGKSLITAAATDNSNTIKNANTNSIENSNTKNNANIADNINSLDKLYGTGTTLNIDIHYLDDVDGTSYKEDWFTENLSNILSIAEPIILNFDLKIYDCGDYYYIAFPSSKKLEHIFMDKAGLGAHLFCKMPDEYDLTDGSEESLYTRLRKMKEARGVPVFALSDNDTPLPRLKDDIFQAIRLLFLYVAHNRNMLMLHSSSLLYQDKAWLFSASSGTGKSTHTNLWVKLFNTPLINGDLNLIAFENGIPVVKGTPWCGTSGICDVAAHPLGGIILLKRNSTDFTEELSADEKRLYVLQRLISPAWNEKQIKKSINFLEKTVDNILVCRLNCTKEDSAAICMKARIDAYLSIL